MAAEPAFEKPGERNASLAWCAQVLDMYRGWAGKRRMQICTDLPCALRGADKFMDDLCANLGINVGETTPDGTVTLEAVTCLAACDKAPMFQTQGPDGIKYHENMTVDRTIELIRTLKNAVGEAK